LTDKGAVLMEDGSGSESDAAPSPLTRMMVRKSPMMFWVKDFTVISRF
jgi:hypothetical protein